MNMHQGFFSISDWWNYSSAASDAVTGGSLHDHLVEGRAGAHIEQDVAAGSAPQGQGYGVIAAEVARAASQAALAGRARADGNGWTPECFAGWNAKSV